VQHPINCNKLKTKTMQTKSTRGGKRVNAGRKPSGIKKQPITIYINKEIVEQHGKPKLKILIIDFLNNYKNVISPLHNN
jgi:hypothetical protein